jgi:hypothetical protein
MTVESLVKPQEGVDYFFDRGPSKAMEKEPHLSLDCLVILNNFS